MIKERMIADIKEKIRRLQEDAIMVQLAHGIADVLPAVFPPPSLNLL